jgi:glycosyltransferase involved in cell wall biosynthesis
MAADPQDRPRIAVVAHAHPSVSKGGSEIAAHTLYRGLLDLGHDAVLIAACPEASRGRLQFDTPGERALIFAPERNDAFYNPGTPGLARRLVAMLRAEDIGRVSFHHHLNIGLAGLQMVSRMSGLRSLLTLHEYTAICQRDGQMVTRPGQALCHAASAEACGGCFPEYELAQFALRRDRYLGAFGRIGHFVAPSRFLMERYIAWGLPPERISVIENGLPGGAGTAPAAVRPSGDAPWVFGYFGQLNPYKGIDVLLRAAELIAARPALAARLSLRIHGTVVGQPAAFRERLEAAVARYPFLSFAGPYQNRAVRPLMAACDYVLVPSTWWENSPVVIQEAFAAGRPVICSGIGGMAEKVQDGVSGLHVRVGDPVDLVAVMQRAMDPALAATLAAGLPRPIDGAAMARQYLACLERNAVGLERPGA